MSDEWKHPDCRELLKGCMMAEHKGYPPCSGYCEHGGTWKPMTPKEASDAAYAVDCGIRRDMDNRFTYTQDMAPDGRPLYVGTMAYETWVKSARRSTTEKDRT